MIVPHNNIPAFLQTDTYNNSSQSSEAYVLKTCETVSLFKHFYNKGLQTETTGNAYNDRLKSYQASAL